MFISLVIHLCPPLSRPLNANVIGFNRRKGSVFTIVCHQGYLLPGGGTVRTVVCLEGGQWSSSVTGCNCEEMNGFKESCSVSFNSRMMLIPNYFSNAHLRYI